MMAEKSRLSTTSTLGAKRTSIAAQLKRSSHRETTSNPLSNADDGQEEQIDVENLLGIEDLEKLRLEGFSKHDLLDKRQFLEFARNSLHHGADKDYDELFECVDITKEGFISWEKLSTYLMLKLYDNEDREKASSVPNWRSGKSLPNDHRDSIKRIQYIDGFSRYISMSKEGTVCIYNAELQLHKTFKAVTESCKVRDLWITDFVLMANLNKVAISYTSKELIIYDFTSKLELSLAYRIVGINDTPFCLDYWCDPENPNDAILSWGDVKGNVHAVLFNSAIIALFERPPQQTTKTAYTRVKLEDIANGNYKNASYVTYHAHMEWTRKVQYADHLDCFISCSTHAPTALVFGWMDKSGLTVRADHTVRIRHLREPRNVVEISQGLNSFDYSRTHNLIATAGVNNHVSLWNPFVLTKPNGLLRGHMRSVIHVQFITNRGQVLSLSKDKILRIWDIQLQICLQRMSNMFPRGPDVDIFCWLDIPRNRLFASFRTSICILEIKPEIKNRIMTHERAIVAARYLVRQKQVMVVCQGGHVSFWSSEGQRMKRFNDQNVSETIDTTCLGFDEFGEKFYTGATDGKIRIWNYNGRVLHILDAGRGTAVEITQIEALKRRIVAVGWTQQLAVFRDIQETEGRPSLPSEWKEEKDKNKGHEDDIICMAVTSFSPQLLASGSTDGEICIWNTSSESFIRRLDQRKRNPDNTQSEMEDDAADFGITTLRFLDKRMTSSTAHSSTGANLVSCGGIAFVRFWNAYTGKLVGEFQAHMDVASIIMEVDANYKHLATGDLNGLVKIWDIEEYCIRSDSAAIDTSLPPLLIEFTPHSDSITCIDFFDKDKRVLVLTSSSDCSVVLSDIHGHIYGIFGQPNQWHLDENWSKANDESPLTARTEESEDADEGDVETLDLNTPTASARDPDLSMPAMDEAMLTRRSNVWESTSIGVTYQEKRTNRRQRNQPSLITKKDYLQWEKTGLAPGGAYGALETFEPPYIPEHKKPEGFDTAHVFRIHHLNDDHRRRPPPTMIGENLKSTFDERAIFPKYILDYEAKQRQSFELSNQQHQSTTTTAANANPHLQMRHATDAVLKSKQHRPS